MIYTEHRVTRMIEDDRLDHFQRRTRRSRSPLTDAVGRFHKFFSLFDGSRTVKSVLKRAFDAVFVKEKAAVISYSADHSLDALLDSSRAIFERFVTWSELRMVVVIDHIQILAPTVIEYVIHVQPAQGKTRLGSDSIHCCLARRTFVCTATLQNGKILSCIEKTVNYEGNDVEDESKTESLSKETNEDIFDISLSALSLGSSSSSSGSEFCKGTSLEGVEQSGGSIFINENSKATLITVVTEQDGVHQELELIEVKEHGDSFDASTSSSFLLRDITTEEKRNIVLCRPSNPDQKRGTFYIDGSSPVVDSDKPVSQHDHVHFFPRYEFDQFSNHVFLWNGSYYESYMNAFEDDSSAQSTQHVTKADLAQFVKENDWSQHDECEMTQDIVAHISRTGHGTKKCALRAKIKIPSGEDPSLIICLMAIGYRSINGSINRSKSYRFNKKKFTKLRIRRTSSDNDEKATPRHPFAAPHPCAQHQMQSNKTSKVSWILNERSSFGM